MFCASLALKEIHMGTKKIIHTREQAYTYLDGMIKVVKQSQFEIPTHLRPAMEDILGICIEHRKQLDNSVYTKRIEGLDQEIQAALISGRSVLVLNAINEFAIMNRAIFVEKDNDVR